MNFKSWLILSEAIDTNTKNLLAKQKAPQDQLNAFIKELEDEPTIIDKPTAFQRFQDKFLTNKEKPKDEDAQRKHFATIPNTTEEELQTYDYYKNENKDSLKKMMEQLRKFIDKKLITLKIKNNIPVIYRNTTQGSNKLDTPDFGRFTSQLDSIQGEITKYKGKGKYFNPIEEELNHKQNLVVKGNNIWVFKGHAPDVCRIYGKGHPWCISDSNSAAHWFNYRIQHHQTQYFVFDFNKDEDDPARYVNPGVAPQGMYSEWVDAINKHSPDPDAREDRSHVGINGYKSINEYKEYLVSKGIPLTTWTTIPPEDWEERLHQYYEDEDFQGAKKDSEISSSRVFPMYLKIINKMNDSDFKTLTDDQKKEFLLGKIDYMGMNQFDYAIENFKGEYYNSLDLTGKIRFALRTYDQDKLLKLAENIKLTVDNVRDLLQYATDKYKMAEQLQKEIDNISKLDDSDVSALLKYATDKYKMEQIIIKYKSELNSYNVRDLLQSATDKEKMAEQLQKETDNISKLDSDNIKVLIIDANEKNKMAEIIIKYKSDLTNYDVSTLLQYATDKDKIAELLQKETDNISKLDDDNIRSLLSVGNDNVKYKLARIINKYHIDKTPEIKQLISKYL